MFWMSWILDALIGLLENVDVSGSWAGHGRVML